MLLLPGRPGSRKHAQGVAERLVIGEEDELPILQHEVEVVDGGVDGEQLPVEGAVMSLCRQQLL